MMRILSASKTTRQVLVKNGITMKIETLKQRLKKDRPMKSINLRIPEDVIEDLRAIMLRMHYVSAPLLGFSGYQPLIRNYIGQGLRIDLEKLENNPLHELIESLKRHGVEEDVINNALNENIDVFIAYKASLGFVWA